jgi:uncharacterized protein YlbG (UPF0298 family)
VKGKNEQMDILLSLYDMNKINELKEYGGIVYVSKYINVVGMSCPNENLCEIK